LVSSTCHMPNQGDELRPLVTTTTKVLPLTPLAPAPTRQVELKDHDRKARDRKPESKLDQTALF